MARDGNDHMPMLKADRLNRACEIAGITPEDAKGPSQKRIIAHKRFHVMSILRDWGLSYTEIGRRLNRTHPGIVRGVKKWNCGIVKRPKQVRKKKPDDRREKWIFWNGHTYTIQIRINGKREYFGSGKSLEDAIAIREKAIKGMRKK